jgi:hypothetical protein
MFLHGATILAVGLLAGFADATASQAFSWKNVRIGGMKTNRIAFTLKQ